MKQSNKCGSVKNDEIINLYLLEIWFGPLSQYPLPPGRHQLYLLIKKTEKNKAPRNEIELPADCIILPSPKYTEPKAYRGRLATQP